MKKLTLYPGDLVHRVKIERCCAIESKPFAIRRKQRRESYWNGITITARTRNQTFESHGAAGVHHYNEWPDPERAEFIILVHRPWYNHLRAMIPFLR